MNVYVAQLVKMVLTAAHLGHITAIYIYFLLYQAKENVVLFSQVKINLLV